MKAEGGYTEAHKYLSGCPNPEEFVSQIFTKKEKERKNPSHVEVYGSFFIQWKQKQGSSHMQHLGLSHVFAHEFFKMCFNY